MFLTLIVVALRSMTLPTHQSQVLGPARADHEILTRAMESAHQLLGGERPPDAAQQFANIQNLFNEKISDHFAYEEKHVFPSLILKNPDENVTRKVADLCQEHVALLTEVQRLSVKIHAIDLADCTSELWGEIMEFFSDFYQHLTKEDQLFKSCS